MTDTERRSAASKFAADWKGRGDEKQETQAFWLALLQKIYGIEEPEKYISFELPVKLDHTSFIDGYIADTRVLIEQKGQDIDLRKGYKQSDGSMLTPFGQARCYAMIKNFPNLRKAFDFPLGRLKQCKCNYFL